MEPSTGIGSHQGNPGYILTRFLPELYPHLKPEPPCAPQGAGLLLAESIVSVSNCLHSRAPRLLALLLEEDLVKCGDLRTVKVQTLMHARPHTKPPAQKAARFAHSRVAPMDTGITGKMAPSCEESPNSTVCNLILAA